MKIKKHERYAFTEERYISLVECFLNYVVPLYTSVFYQDMNKTDLQ